MENVVRLGLHLFCPLYLLEYEHFYVKQGSIRKAQATDSNLNWSQYASSNVAVSYRYAACIQGCIVAVVRQTEFSVGVVRTQMPFAPAPADMSNLRQIHGRDDLHRRQTVQHLSVANTVGAHHAQTVHAHIVLQVVVQHCVKLSALQ